MGEPTAENVLPPASLVVLDLIKRHQQELIGRTLEPEGRAQLEQSQYNQALSWMRELVNDPSYHVHSSTEQPTPETFYYVAVALNGQQYNVMLMPSGNIVVADTRSPNELKNDKPPFLESQGRLKLPKVNIISSVPAGMKFSSEAPNDVTIYEESFIGDRYLGAKETVIKPAQTQKQIEEIAATNVTIPRAASPGK